MPRFSFKGDPQKTKEIMNKSKPAPASTSPSPLRQSARRSAPSPHASSTLETLSKDDEKTPASILKSGRYRIQVQRTDKGDDGFADDSPYWEAAKLASTQDSLHGDSESSSPDEGKKVDSKELKRREKQKKKRAEIEKLQNEYKEGQAKLKPNFDIGTGSQSESSDHNGSDSDNGEWLRTSLQRNGKRKGSRAAMFSPSDLSRASTIPPTPATPKDNGTPTSIKQHRSLEEENVEDLDVNMLHNDDDSNEEEVEAKAPLSPIHEEHVVTEARARKDDASDKLEDKLLDVLDNMGLHPDEGDAAKIDFPQNDDYSDGDNDGPGFELADNQPSPQAEMDDSSSSNKEMDTKRSKGRKGDRKKSIDSEESGNIASNAESRSKLSRKKSKRKESIDSEESGSKKIPPKKKSRGRLKKVKISAPSGGPGYQSGPREYRTIPAEEFEEDDDGTEGVRRSRRRKFRPLLFWKNEKIVYEPNHEEGVLAEIFGDMPMVTGVQQAQPTPYKKRTVTPKSDSDDDNESGRKAAKKSNKGNGEVKLFDSNKLRKKFDIDDGDTAPIWWDSESVTLEKKVIYYSEKMTLHDLPLDKKKRKKKDGKVVAKAAQAFNVDPPGDGMPGFICGCMVVPPQGIKDEEGVGPCFQVFNVGDCQPKSVELAIADPEGNGGNYDAGTAKRFLLSKGDMFQIPAGNVYRIQNHSKSISCTLNWTIVRPAPREGE